MMILYVLQFEQIDAALWVHTPKDAKHLQDMTQIDIFIS